MKAALVAVLKAVCPRVYPHMMAPAGVARPYVTYQRFAGKSVNYTDDAIPDIGNAGMQINVWSDRQADADMLIKQIEDAIRTAPTIQGRPISQPIDDYEEDTKLCSAMQRFDIWKSQ